MYWRLEKGRWEAVKGPPAKKRLREGIREGSVLGVLAYIDGEPIGWCTFGPRPSYARLDRAPSLKCEDGGEVWSVPCFYVKSGFRGVGVGRALLAAALKGIRRRGGRIVEGYPSRPGKDGTYVAAFSWTGTRSLFAKAGFRVAGNRDGGKQRVRLALGRS
jgi:GNAT superfamily N-acetyltransferase